MLLRMDVAGPELRPREVEEALGLEATAVVRWGDAHPDDGLFKAALTRWRREEVHAADSPVEPLRRALTLFRRLPESLTAFGRESCAVSFRLSSLGAEASRAARRAAEEADEFQSGLTEVASLADLRVELGGASLVLLRGERPPPDAFLRFSPLLARSAP